MVTRMYDQHLREFGLEAPQFALLTAVERVPGKSQAVLAQILGFEKATLSRNLKLMEQKGWVTARRGVSLTEAGRALLAQAQVGWEKAHAELQQAMSPEGWNAMWQGLRAMTAAADEVLARRG